MIMMKEKRKFQSLTSKNICEVYDTLHKEGFVTFPITKDAENKVDALVANINGSSFGIPHYPTIEEKVVAYFYFLINNHAFTDGNKRTAIITFILLCGINNLNYTLKGYHLDALAIILEKVDNKYYKETIRFTAKRIFK